MRQALQICLLVVAGGCAPPETSTFVQLNLFGSYSFSYAPEGREPAVEVRPPTVFAGRDVVPSCCLGVYVREPTIFELAVGNQLDAPQAPDADGGCPPVAQVRVWIHGLRLGREAQRIAIAAENTEVAAWYRDEGDPNCPRAVETAGLPPPTSSLTISGSLELEHARCASGSGEDEWPLGCALQAAGAWSLVGTEATGVESLRTAGKFEAMDQEL